MERVGSASSSRMKLDGVRLPVDVKLKSWASFGTASLMMVIEPGKMTASAESERSWFPPPPSRSVSLMWYGEPVMETAALPAPQLTRVAMWPPQARTGFATVVVKLIVIRAVLSPRKPVPAGYE